MQYPQPLQEAVLLKRYQRFLADVQWPDGSTSTVHCPNTGAMTGCAEAGSRVWLLDHGVNTKRKYRFSWELVQTGQGLACIHSARANALVAEALQAGLFPSLADFSERQAEVAYPHGDGRADFRLRGKHGDAFVEVKAVTLCDGGIGLFPDTRSERAARHCHALADAVAAGHQATLIFCVLHEGIRAVRPADTIDPVYGKALRHAVDAGVEVVACRTSLAATGLRVEGLLPWQLDDS